MIESKRAVIHFFSIKDIRQEDKHAEEADISVRYYII